MSKKCLKCGKINDDFVSTCVDCKSNDFQQLETNILIEDKKQNKKDVSKIVFISAFFIVFIILIILIFQYNNIVQQYKKLESTQIDLKERYELLLKERDSLKKKATLSNKSQSEIKKIKEQEIQEKLNSIGLKIVNTKTYWTGKRSETWLAFNSEIYPCIYIELQNTSNKRLDSVIVHASFGNSYGVTDDITDNLHPNYKALVTIKSPAGKKPNGADIRNMPDIEAEVSISVNDGKKISLGLIKIDKKYQQMK